jgi:hypothetical protein
MGILNFNTGAPLIISKMTSCQFAGWKIVLTGLFVIQEVEFIKNQTLFDTDISIFLESGLLLLTY